MLWRLGCKVKAITNYFPTSYNTAVARDFKAAASWLPFSQTLERVPALKVSSVLPYTLQYFNNNNNRGRRKERTVKLLSYELRKRPVYCFENNNEWALRYTQQYQLGQAFFLAVFWATVVSGVSGFLSFWQNLALSYLELPKRKFLRILAKI